MEDLNNLGKLLFNSPAIYPQFKGGFKSKRIVNNTIRWFYNQGNYNIVAYTNSGVFHSIQFQHGEEFMFTFTQLADSMYAVIGTDNQGTAYDGIYTFKEIKGLLYSIMDFLYNTIELGR